MSHVVRDRPAIRRALPATIAFLAACAVLLAPASAGAALFTGEVVFGPHGGLRAMGNVDITSDGTGAVTYTVVEEGAEHVFVSRLVNGAWGGPERVDPGLPGPSSQPHVSTSPGGRVAVSYANGGNVYVASRAPGAPGWTVQAVWGAGGASEPWVDLGVNGKAYLVFTAPGAGGNDVRLAYSKNSAPFELLGAPLDANPAADAGSGAGRPRVGSAASGAAVAAWGESGTVMARRVVGTRPSPVFANAAEGLTVEGRAPVALDTPEVAAQDDDSFTGVAVRAHFDVDGRPQTRAVYNRLRGSRFEWRAVLDAISFGSGQSSSGARMSNTGVGQGLAIGVDETTNLTYALTMRADLAPIGVVQVDSIAASTRPTFAVTGTATPLKMMVAWQYTGPDGATDVRGRFYNGRELEPEQVLSRPEHGPTAADRGIWVAGGDNGDIAVVWVQDIPGQGPALVSSVIDQPPARFARKAPRVAWERTTTPTLAWSSAREAWGLGYKVAVDGAEVITTPRTSFRLRTPVADGVHSWAVTAVDRRGQTFATTPGQFRVDTLAPTTTTRLSGALRPGATLKLTLQPSDPPPTPAKGAQPARTSGIASVIVDWGDKTRRERVRLGAQHAYARAGRYTIRVTVADKAGNKAVVRQVAKIVMPRRARRGARDGGRERAADMAAARVARSSLQALVRAAAAAVR